MLYSYRTRPAFTIALSLLFLTPGETALAQLRSVDRPERKDCSGIRRQDFDSRADWINARIDCKFENTNAELFNLVDLATNPSVALFTVRQKEHFMKARERAEKARKRTMAAGTFKQWARKDNVDCFVREFDEEGHADNDGNNDGVCITKGPDRENCLEVIGDQIGNDDGVCKANEVCVEICDQPSIDEADDNFDEEEAADVEESLDDVTEILAETNKQVALRVQLMALAKSTSARNESVSGSANDCIELLKKTRHFDFTTLEGVQAGANVAAGAHAACDSACNQDVLGNNGSSACVVLAVAAGVLQTVAEAFELSDDDVTATRVDAAVVCLEQLDVQLKETKDAIGEVNEQIAAINDKIDTLTALVTERFDRLDDALSTPPGRRQNFPTKP